MNGKKLGKGNRHILHNSDEISLVVPSASAAKKKGIQDMYASFVYQDCIESTAMQEGCEEGGPGGQYEIREVLGTHVVVCQQGLKKRVREVTTLLFFPSQRQFCDCQVMCAPTNRREVCRQSH